MYPLQRQGPAMLTNIHILLSSWDDSQAVFLTVLQFGAKLWSVACGQVLVATGTTFKAVSCTVSLSARARTSKAPRKSEPQDGRSLGS